MLPLIIGALSELLAGGAVAAEGGAIAAGAGAAEGGALARGAASLSESAGSASGKSILSRSTMLQTPANFNIPGIIKNKFEKHKEGGRHPLADSDNAYTQEGIEHLFGGKGEKKTAANDPDIIFGGAPTFDKPMYNPAQNLFGNNRGAPINDNEREDTSILKLMPILESIDRNTYQTQAQIKEINSKLEKFFADNSINDLASRENSIESSDGSASPIDRANSEKNDLLNPKPGSNPSEDKKPGIMDSVKNMLTGGLLWGAGKVISSVTGDNPNTQRETVQGGGYGGNSGAVRGEANPNDKNARSRYQLQLFDAFKKQGLSDEGAKTMVAQVGRENNYNPNNLFGTHIDPYNHKINAGIISWQGDRAKNLLKYLGDRGLVDSDGKIKKGQQSLEAQAEFLVKEMGANKRMAPVLKDLKDPSKKYEDVEAGVGDRVIAWRRNDPRYRAGGYRNQNRAFAEIDSLVKGRTGDQKYTDWGSSFDPIAEVRNKLNAGVARGQFDAKRNLGGAAGMHDRNHKEGDAVDFMVPQNSTRDAFIKQLKGMYPKAEVAAGGSKNEVHVTFKGWGGAPMVDADGHIQGTGKRKGNQLDNMSRQNGGGNTTNITVNNNSKTTTAPTHQQSAPTKKPTPPKPGGYLDTWTKYFSL